MSTASDILAAGLATLATVHGHSVSYRTTTSGSFTALTGFLIIQDRPNPHGFDGDREMETQTRNGWLKGPLTPAMADGYQVKDENTGSVYACYEPKFEAQQIARLECVTVEEFGPDRKGQR
jgi:hypothetical protein